MRAVADARSKEEVVNRVTMLATADGRWVLAGSAEFLDALGDRDPDYDAALFAVKNLGFVQYQTIGDLLVEIELHPRNVVLPALLAVQQRIASSPASLFRIKYLDTVWQSEISTSTEHTVARLSELCAAAFVPPPTDKYVVERQDFSKLFEHAEDPFCSIAQKWRMAFGYFDETVLPFAIKHGLLSRMIIIGVKRRSGESVFRFIGNGFQWVGEEYLVKGVGDKVEDQPDKEYGAWVSEFYRSVAGSGQPRHDLVSAAIRWEDEPGKPFRVSRYERLLLPWRTPLDETFVTVSSRVLRNRSLSEASSALPSHSRRMKSARSS
jgi:hypothetical protein